MLNVLGNGQILFERLILEDAALVDLQAEVALEGFAVLVKLLAKALESVDRIPVDLLVNR